MSLDPERAARILSAKASELETRVLAEGVDSEIGYLTADVGLIAELLAQHMETCTSHQRWSSAHIENLIVRTRALEVHTDYDATLDEPLGGDAEQ